MSSVGFFCRKITKKNEGDCLNHRSFKNEYAFLTSHLFSNEILKVVHIKMTMYDLQLRTKKNSITYFVQNFSTYLICINRKSIK